jgi:flavin-dependent dehydrogenase
MCPKPYAGVSSKTVYELTVGVPALGPPAPSAKQEIDHFISRSNFAPWFKHARIIDTRAAALNFYTPLIHPVEGNVVVVGDAAAFIETYVQGAIMYGYQAAHAIAKQLATGAGLDEYARSWEHSFEYNDPEEIKLSTQGFGLHVLDDDDIDYLFGLTAGDDIRGFVNEFSEPLTVRTAILRHMAQIKCERPALAAALDRFSEVSVHDALQVGIS